MKPKSKTRVKKQSLISRNIYKKFIIEEKFDPYNPSDKLMLFLNDVRLPSSCYLKNAIRGKRICDIEADELFYVAYEMIRGLPELRLSARMLYTIKYYTDESQVTRQELYDEITSEEEQGYISEIYVGHLKPWRSLLHGL